MGRSYIHDNEASGLSTSVYLSEDSAEHYGRFAPEFPIWANTQGLKQVIIVTPEDVLGGRDPETMTKDEKIAAFQEFLAKHPEFPAEAFTDGVTPSVLSEAAVNGSGKAEQRDLDGDGVNDALIVIARSRDETREVSALGLAGAFKVPDVKLENLSGTDLEWQIGTIAHEIGHGDQPTKSWSYQATLWEANAEQNMIQFLQSAAEKGLLSDPALIAQHVELRAFASLYFRSDLPNHKIGPFVASPGEDGAIPADDIREDVFPGLDRARESARRVVGAEHITEKDMRDEIERFYSQDGVYSFGSMKRPDQLSVEDRKILIDIMEGDLPVKEGLEKLSDDVRQLAEDAIDFKARIIGNRFLTEDPHLMYETMRQLYLSGEFDPPEGATDEQTLNEYAVAKTYAYEFLISAQKYAPSYFGVTDTAEQFEKPPLPDQTDFTHNPTNHPDLGYTITPQ